MQPRFFLIAIIDRSWGLTEQRVHTRRRALLRLQQVSRRGASGSHLRRRYGVG